jgi:hypothetical protein
MRQSQIRYHGTGREEFALWAEGIARTAGETGAYCKSPDWSPNRTKAGRWATCAPTAST